MAKIPNWTRVNDDAESTWKHDELDVWVIVERTGSHARPDENWEAHVSVNNIDIEGLVERRLGQTMTIGVFSQRSNAEKRAVEWMRDNPFDMTLEDLRDEISVTNGWSRVSGGADSFHIRPKRGDDVEIMISKKQGEYLVVALTQNERGYVQYEFPELQKTFDHPYPAIEYANTLLRRFSATQLQMKDPTQEEQ